MRKTLLLLASLTCASVLVGGCGSSTPADPPGYSKKDFAKVPPPAGYMSSVPKGGPASAPAGPPPGAATGPAAGPGSDKPK